jgi:hypothetical protein
VKWLIFQEFRDNPQRAGRRIFCFVASFYPKTAYTFWNNALKITDMTANDITAPRPVSSPAEEKYRLRGGPGFALC